MRERETRAEVVIIYILEKVKKKKKKKKKCWGTSLSHSGTLGLGLDGSSIYSYRHLKPPLPLLLLNWRPPL